MVVSCHFLVTGTPPHQCPWQSNPKEAWQQGGSREVGCLLILQNADDNTSSKGASKGLLRKDFTWNPARRREVPRTSFFFSGITARHLTFEILRPGSTLILAKICSSSLPPWFSSLLVTTSEATRKYSQVSAKLSLSRSSQTNTQGMPWPISTRQRFQVFKSWLFQLSSVNQVFSLVLTTPVPKQS